MSIDSPTTAIPRSSHRRIAFASVLVLSLAALQATAQTAPPPAPAPAAASGYQYVVSPDNSLRSIIADTSNQLVLTTGFGGWGPKWTWKPSPISKDLATGDHLALSVPFPINARNGDVVNVALDGSASSNTAITYKYTLSATRDVPITIIIADIHASKDATSGSLAITADGKEIDTAFPINSLDRVANVSSTVFHLPTGDIQITFDPPASIQYDGNGYRVLLASDVVKTGSTTTTVTYTFPKPVTYVATQDAVDKFVDEPGSHGWFVWDAEDHTSPSVFDMSGWLDAPAGKHGGVRMVGDQFQFEDGTPVKFWGTNLAYGAGAPEHAVGENLATRFARYGINAVRLHKFSGAGWAGIGDPNDVTKFDAKGLERFDYFTSQLASRGIYYGFSHTYGMDLRPGNRDQILAYDEIKKNLKGNTYGLINFAPDLQDLLIQLVVNLLQHKNPYTGKTYAEDPALCYVELQNEDDILFYTTTAAYKACPTYAAKFRESFADWLSKRYGTQEALAKAWGDGLNDPKVALTPDTKETLAAKNINIITNPWFFGKQALSRDTPGQKRRAIDTALFLHDTQDAYYSRFIKAIRDTGYKGPICGSPWQAPPMIPHYLNLLSDYEAGYIDRHNYFASNNVAATMLSDPGSGYISTGLQQVVNRPFGVSEWISNFPLMYQAEGPVLFAAYGLGLQGWDSSYEFQSSPKYGKDGTGWFAPNAGNLPFGCWVVDSPSQLGQFPALARMIYRGDVKQGDIISVRKVSMRDISSDTFNFTDTATQMGDIKLFSGSCPMAALAAGRCVIQFTDTPTPSILPDMTRYQKGTAITSNTGQLVWDGADKGFITINTAGTKVVCGFARGKTQKLGNVTITSQTPYASIILTALDKGATLDNARSALLTVVARTESTGFTYNTLNGQMLNPGTAPLLIEPVQADIAVSGRTVAAVNVLSQNGALTTNTVPVSNGSFHIDSGQDKTIYYQVVFR